MKEIYKKPNCKTCEHKKICGKRYSKCHELTGFTSPCNNCELLIMCKGFTKAVKIGRVIYECKHYVEKT